VTLVASHPPGRGVPEEAGYGAGMVHPPAPGNPGDAPGPLELTARPLDVLRSETSPAAWIPAVLNAGIAIVAYTLALSGASGRLWFFGSLFAVGAVMLGLAATPDRLTLRADAAGLGLVRRTRPGGRSYGWLLPWSQVHGFRAAGRWVELLVTEEPLEGEPHPEDPPRWERLTGGTYGRSSADLAAALEARRAAARRASVRGDDRTE
jgi:hypothetical protein